MSKRSITTQSIVVPQLPDELWFTIAEFIEWHDIETLLTFIGVCRNAILFVQPRLRLLCADLVQVAELKPQAQTMPYQSKQLHLRQAYARQSMIDGALCSYLQKCLLGYASVSSATLTQWRKWSSTILETLALFSLLEECLYPNASGCFIEHTVHGKALLANVYYTPRDGTAARRLDTLPITHSVHGMETTSPTILISEARVAVRFAMTESEQQVYLEALGDDFGAEGVKRALCYYALKKTGKVTVEVATPTDRFRDVVLADPHINGDFLHIYSRRSAFVTKFVTDCRLYTGKPERAALAFNLCYNQARYRKQYEELCKSISRAMNAAIKRDSLSCK